MKTKLTHILCSGAMLAVTSLTTLARAQTSSAQNSELLPIEFNLANLQGSSSEARLQVILHDPRVQRALVKSIERDEARRTNNTGVEPSRDNAIIIFPGVSLDHPSMSQDEQILGLSQIQALRASRDGISSSVFTDAHIHDDLANRWGHAAVTRIFTSELEARGLNPAIASVLGAMLLLPKEYFYDLHPSAADMLITYHDRLGTKRSEFEITVFGDAIWKKRPGDEVTPFKGSGPFLTIRRKLGPAPREE